MTDDRPFCFTIPIPSAVPSRIDHHIERRLSAMKGQFCDAQAYEDTDTRGNYDRHTNAHGDIDRHCHADGHCHSDGHVDRHGYCDADPHAHSSPDT